jgi:hypothetical protein
LQRHAERESEAVGEAGAVIVRVIGTVDGGVDRFAA